MLNINAVEDGIRGAMVLRGAHRKRLVEAWGENVVPYVDHFTSLPVDDSTGDPTAWTITVVEAGTGNSTATSADASGGALLLTTDDNENDGVNLQLNGESFKFQSTNDVYVGFMGVTVSEATQSDFFLGLAVTNTDIIGNDAERVGFQCVDGSTDIKGLAGQAADLSDALGTLSTSEFDIELYWNGSAIEAFIDGSSVGAIAVTNIPSGELRVSLQWLAGAAGTPITLQVDKIVVFQIGN